MASISEFREDYLNDLDYRFNDKNRFLQDNQNDMEKEVHLLSEELKLSRDNEKRMREECIGIIESCNSCSSLKFRELEENVRNLEEQNMELKTDIDNLHLSITAEKMNLKQAHDDEMNAMIDKHKEEVKIISDELHGVKECLERKEKDLYTEKQILQAQSDIHCDVIETRYIKQISDLNTKLRNAHLSNVKLRSEKQNMIAQYALRFNNKDKEIIELKNKLKDAENMLLETRNQSNKRQVTGQAVNNSLHETVIEKDVQDLEDFCEFGKEFDKLYHTSSNCDERHEQAHEANILCANVVNERSTKMTDNRTKPPAPEVINNTTKSKEDTFESDNFETLEVEQILQPTKKILPTIYKGRARYGNRSGRQEKVTCRASPLRQISIAKKGDTEVKNATFKKRKLFNPNDLDYLNQLEIQD